MKAFLFQLGRYNKAWLAAATASLGSAYVALNDGAVSGQEWVGIAQAALAAGVTVAGIPNAKTADEKAAADIVAASRVPKKAARPRATS